MRSRSAVESVDSAKLCPVKITLMQRYLVISVAVPFAADLAGPQPRFPEHRCRMFECASMALWDIRAKGGEREVRMEPAAKPAAGRTR